MKLKLIRVTTVPISMNILLRNQLKYMGSIFDVIGVTGKDDFHFGDVKKRECIRMVDISMTREISPLSDLVSLIKAYRLFKRERPAIVHSHTPKAGLISMISARLAGVPVRLHTVAGMPLMQFSGSKRKLLILAEKITYLCSNGVYPNSDGLKSWIVDNICRDEKKIKVLGNGSSNGIDIHFFSISDETEMEAGAIEKKYNLTPDLFRFIFIGRIVAQKGIVELVDAFIEINRIDQKTRLLLIGPFERIHDALPVSVRKLINDHPHIISTGSVRDVRPWLHASDVCVFPSHREGFPNVPMQAGAMGLPVIASDINGCNEIIIDSKNGLLFPSGDKSALQAAMVRLMNDSSLRKALQNNARSMIASRYDQSVIWNLILNEYRVHLAAAGIQLPETE